MAEAETKADTEAEDMNIEKAEGIERARSEEEANARALSRLQGCST